MGEKKDRGRETGFSALAAREMKRVPKNERGGRERGRKETSFLPLPLPALLLAPLFAPSLTLVLRSLFLNHTETLATQASSIA